MDERLRKLERQAAAGDELAGARLEAERARSSGRPHELIGYRPIHGLVLVLGGRGSGKTTLLQAIVERWRKRGCTFVVWDRLGHWEKKPGLTVVATSNPEDVALEAIRLAPTTLVLDEVHLAFPASGWSPKKTPALNEIVKVGRQAAAVGPYARKGPVALIGAAQRPANVHPDLKGLVDRVIYGRFSDTATTDLRWLEGVLDEATVATLPHLGVGQFRYRDCA